MSVARGGQSLAIPLRREKMVYQSRITNATRRTTLVLVFLCLCGANILAAAHSSNVAPDNLAKFAATLEDPVAQQKPSPSPAIAASASTSPATDKSSQSQQG